MAHWDIWLLMIMGLVGLVAGFVDTLAGGGGLLTIPALMIAGLPGDYALGTNKFQATFGSGMATLRFALKGQLPWHQVRWGVLWCFIGATLGTVVILLLHVKFLEKVIPFLLSIVLIYSLLCPKVGLLDTSAKIRPSWFFLLFGTGLGFYDGFFGPGTGAFWAISLVYFLGFNLQKATIYTKLFNFVSNVVSLVWFMFGGKIAYPIALVMAAGQFLGAWTASHMVLTKGVRLIRPVFLTMVFCLTITLFFKAYLQ